MNLNKVILMNTLSVVIPTLNCAAYVTAHLDSMKSWLDLADEVIVVDSHSDDGTPDMIRKGLRHPNVRVLSHPRGLYQSWNFGIQQTTGRWIYISTIGDTIEREQLKHMLDAGETLRADVVVSPPQFVVDENLNISTPIWPIHQILEYYNITEPTKISSKALFIHAMQHIPNAILGSSASNLYKGDHLRSRPFPLGYGVTGDTGWAIQHCLDTSFCFTNRIGSVFRFHSEIHTRPNDGWLERLIQSLQVLGTQVMDESPHHEELREILALLNYRESRKRYLHKYIKNWKNSQLKLNINLNIKVPWYLYPKALRARTKRKKAEDELCEVSKKINCFLTN